MKNEKEKKKFKSRVLSALVIFIGVVLVFAGYWTMQQLLQRRQEQLLSQSGETKTALDEEMDADNEERDKLTKDELEDILIRSAFSGEANPHEPYGRQMTMQEAIETGQAWIDSFCAKYGYPSADGTVAYEGISAALYTDQLDTDLLIRTISSVEDEAAEESGAQSNRNEEENVQSGMEGSADSRQETGTAGTVRRKSVAATGDADGQEATGDANAQETAGSADVQEAAGDADGQEAAGDADTQEAAGDANAQTTTGDTDVATAAEDDSVTENDSSSDTETQPVFDSGVELSESSGDELAESMYGYWELTFSGSDMNITLKLNAVTGQVLYVSMECSSYTVSIDEVSLSAVVSEYADSFELGDLGSVSSTKDDFTENCVVDYDGKIFFTIDSYIYDAAELGYPDDSGYMRSGFTMYVGVGNLVY